MTTKNSPNVHDPRPAHYSARIPTDTDDAVRRYRDDVLFYNLTRIAYEASEYDDMCLFLSDHGGIRIRIENQLVGNPYDKE